MNDFEGFEATYLSHLQVRNEIKKKKEKFHDMSLIDHCLCKVQQL